MRCKTCGGPASYSARTGCSYCGAMPVLTATLQERELARGRVTPATLSQPLRKRSA